MLPRAGMDGEGAEGEASLLFCEGAQTVRLLFSGPPTAGDDTVMVIFLISPPKSWKLTHGVKMEVRVGLLPKSFPSTASRIRRISNVQNQNSLLNEPVFWPMHVRWAPTSFLTFYLHFSRGVTWNRNFQPFSCFLAPKVGANMTGDSLLVV